MKTLPLLLLSLWYCYGTIVVYIHNEHSLEVKEASLTFDNYIEITNLFTLCLRLNIKDHWREQIFFHQQQWQSILGLGFSFKIGMGYLVLNQKMEMFKIPKDVFQPYMWNHVCLSIDEKTITFIGNGHLWYQGSRQYAQGKTKVNQLKFGTNSLVKHTYWEDFIGRICELNIWSKALSNDELRKITKTCGNVTPTPDVLNWSKDVKSSMLTGEFVTQDINQICHNGNGTVVHHILVPLLFNQDDALNVCKISQGELAYPKRINEYNDWQSKKLRLVKPASLCFLLTCCENSINSISFYFISAKNSICMWRKSCGTYKINQWILD